MATAVVSSGDTPPKAGSMTRSASTRSSKRSPHAQQGQIVLVPVTDKMLKDNDVLEWDTWEHDGGTFDHTYQNDEDLYVVKGKCIVTPQGGQPVTIKPGDFVAFPAGLACEWNVIKPVVAHCQEYEDEGITARQACCINCCVNCCCFCLTDKWDDSDDIKPGKSKP